MKKPDMDLWCERFVVAVAKNTPRHDVPLTTSQMFALATSVMRRHLEKKTGVSLCHAANGEGEARVECVRDPSRKCVDCELCGDKDSTENTKEDNNGK